LCAETRSVEAMTMCNTFFVFTVFWAINKITCFSGEANVAHASAVTVASTVSTATFWALFETTISVGETSIACTYTRWGTFTMFTTHIWARFHSTVQTTVTFSTFAYTVGTFTTTGAVIWARFDGAICANEWVLTYAFEVSTSTVSATVFWADHFLARNTFPSLSTDTSTVVAIAMLSTCIGAQSDGAISTTPSWVTKAFVWFFCTANTMSATVVFTYHNGAVTAFPSWHTFTVSVFTYTISSAHTTIFHWASWYIACFTGVVRVTGTQSVHFTFTVTRAILWATWHGAVNTSPPWVTGTVTFAASTVVGTIFWASAFRTIFPCEAVVTVTCTVPAFTLRRAAV